MFHRHLLPALAISALIASPAFAEIDAGPADAGPTDAGPADAGGPATVTDAGPTQDGGSVDGGVMDPDAMGAPDSAQPVDDAVTPPDGSTGTTTSFGANPCWDVKCPKEMKACKDNANCAKYNECEKKGDAKCVQDLQKTASEDIKLQQAFKKCGYAACADPNKGSCASAGKNGAKNRCGQWDDNWPCNCDQACKSYGDCCADHEAVCGGGAAGGSCKGKCGKYDKAAKCQCDPDCKKPENGDCCDDYDKLCGGDDPCKPNCDGKQCGDDGCGGTCGKCTDGGVCDAAGKCIGGKPKVDASGSGDKDGGATAPKPDGGSGAYTDVGTKPQADAASDSTTKPGGTLPPASSSSGGCAISSGGGSAAGLLFAGLALVALIGLRRRFA